MNGWFLPKLWLKMISKTVYVSTLWCLTLQVFVSLVDRKEFSEGDEEHRLQLVVCDKFAIR